MFSSISVLPPSEKANADNLLKADKYVAMVNAPHGPFGYGDTAEEAVANLKIELHKCVDDLQAVLFNDRGTLPKWL